jgi:hypothetical protein
MPEFEEWWRSLFLEIDMRGTELLEQHKSDLRQLPGNPFRLTDDCDDAIQQDDVAEEKDVGKEEDASAEDKAGDMDGGDPSPGGVDENRALNDLGSCGTIEEVEIVDPINRATSEAEMLKRAPQSERSKIVRKYFAKLAKQVIPLEYNHYEGLALSELRSLSIEARVVEERIGGIRSMLEDEIGRRESPASDSRGDV